MSRRMSVVRKRDNHPEMAVRRLLHAAGLRYRVAWPVPGQRRRTIDIAFTRRRLAVYIDGCFWHGCPLHGTSPKANASWWAEKIAANRARDADVTAQLQSLGWTVLRFWEHEDPAAVAAAIADAVRSVATGERDRARGPIDIVHDELGVEPRGGLDVTSGLIGPQRRMPMRGRR